MEGLMQMFPKSTRPRRCAIGETDCKWRLPQFPKETDGSASDRKWCPRSAAMKHPVLDQGEFCQILYIDVRVLFDFSLVGLADRIVYADDLEPFRLGGFDGVESVLK